VNVSAVVVTRGDVDLDPSVVPLREAGIDDIVVWDNSKRAHDLAVYGRYAAIAEATGAAVVVQDDDVILDIDSVRSLIDAHQPGHVICNMPARFRHGFYRDHCLVGFGAIFDRDLPEQAFKRFGGDRLWSFFDITTFNRTCDIVFTALTPRVLVDVPYRDREFASAPGRMWTSRGHVEERTRMLNLALKVRDR